MNQADREAIFSVNSPLNTKVILHEDTLINHIVGEHSGREVFLNEENLQIVANAIKYPDFIEKSTKKESRKNYYSLIAKSFNDPNKSSVIKIVTQQVNNQNENVVTMMPLNHSNLGEGGEIIYDRHKIKP